MTPAGVQARTRKKTKNKPRKNQEPKKTKKTEAVPAKTEQKRVAFPRNKTREQKWEASPLPSDLGPRAPYWSPRTKGKEQQREAPPPSLRPRSEGPKQPYRSPNKAVGALSKNATTEYPPFSLSLSLSFCSLSLSPSLPPSLPTISLLSSNPLSLTLINRQISLYIYI